MITHEPNPRSHWQAACLAGNLPIAKPGLSTCMHVGCVAARKANASSDAT